MTHLEFDLGGVDGNNGMRAWQLQEVMERAGEEADEDQHCIELILDSSEALDSSSAMGVREGGEEPLLEQEGRRSLQEVVKQISLEVSTSMKNVSKELRRMGSASARRSSEILRRSSELSRSTKLGSVRRPPPDRRRLLLRSKSGAQFALQGLRFISNASGAAADADHLWKSVEARFHRLASSTDGRLSRSDFGLCIGMKDSKEFAGLLFDALSRRRGQALQSMTLEDLKDFWAQISDKSFDSRLRLFFDMCDRNADGRLSKEEVKEVIELSASANKLPKSQERTEEYAALIMEELDPERLGYIELWQLEALLSGQIAKPIKDTSSLSRSLSQNLAPRRHNFAQRAAKKLRFLLDEDWRWLCTVLLWLLATLGLFLWKFFQYRRKAVFQVMGYCVCVAKGAAETLKLNMALVLLPVCRNIITWLRSTKLGSFLPFDDNINFHKILAMAIAFGISLHAGIHLMCDFPRLVSSSETISNCIWDLISTTESLAIWKL